METLKAIQTRNSIPFLKDPAPTPDQMSVLYRGALRAPDHANLRPWKFIEVRGEARTKLGQTFLRTAESLGDNLTDSERDKLIAAPLRAPMIIILAADIKIHPKVPEKI